jgi:hypothetical protein
MARAHYLHVLIDPSKKGFDAVIGIFTVKHEMESFIEYRNIDMTKIEYVRTVDGKYLK